MLAHRITARVAAIMLAATPFVFSMPVHGNAQTPSRVTIAVTETSDTYNPYGDSNSLMYGVWCHVYGCLIEYDFDKADYVGLLAQSWEIANPTTWIFHLRQDVRWQNGDPLRASDVVHSFNRVMSDPQSKQKQNVRLVAQMEAVDDHTVKVTTKEPTAPLLSYLTQFIITNKAVFDRYGAKTADSRHPVGAAEYKLEDLAPGQMFALRKNLDFPGMKDRHDAADSIVYQIVREPAARLVGLFNGEFQIVQRLQPDAIPQVEGHDKDKVVSVPAAEFMFLGMTPKRKPWDNKLVRQAVCYAINRNAIIKDILQGQALRLDGVIGTGQYGYDPNTKERYPFDPDKAKALLTQAGYPNGLDVDFYTSTGRYLFDKTIAEAIVPMLAAVGIRAKLQTPEVSAYWSDIQRGAVPFYYWGRQDVIDPSPALSQYFETGGSPRIGVSDPEIDRLLQLERVTFDPNERKQALNRAFNAILDAAPVCFLWRYRNLYGVAKTVSFKARPDDRIVPTDIKVLQ
jgi:peptide/nickel transport system substrate-binding protein